MLKKITLQKLDRKVFEKLVSEEDKTLEDVYYSLFEVENIERFLKEVHFFPKERKLFKVTKKNISLLYELAKDISLLAIKNRLAVHLGIELCREIHKVFEALTSYYYNTTSNSKLADIEASFRQCYQELKAKL